MADVTDTHAPGMMRPFVPPAAATALLRAEMAQTRLRLAHGITDVQDLAAPSQLLSTGARALRGATANAFAGLAGRAAGYAARPSCPRLWPMMALAAGSVATAVMARRRHQRSHRRSPGRTVTALAAGLLRPGAPWLSVVLSILTAVAKRR